MRKPSPPSRRLSLEDLAAARVAYEGGASYQTIAADFGVSRDTMRTLLRSLGVVSRPVGWAARHEVRRQLEPAPAPQPRPAVQVTPDARGRLRIPVRTVEERRLRRWTAAELMAITVEIRAGRLNRVQHRGSGRPRWQAGATFDFMLAMKRLKAAA